MQRTAVHIPIMASRSGPRATPSVGKLLRTLPQSLTVILRRFTGPARRHVRHFSRSRPHPQPMRCWSRAFASGLIHDTRAVQAGQAAISINGVEMRRRSQPRRSPHRTTYRHYRGALPAVDRTDCGTTSDCHGSAGPATRSSPRGATH